jgi:hypothetical protein
LNLSSKFLVSKFAFWRILKLYRYSAASAEKAAAALDLAAHAAGGMVGFRV